MTTISRHPALDALEDRIQTSVSVSRRRYPTAILYSVRAAGFSETGVSTTITMAAQAFLKNNGLEA